MGRIVGLLKSNWTFLQTIAILVLSLLLLQKDNNLIVELTALVIAIGSVVDLYLQINNTVKDHSKHDEDD